MYSNSRCLIWGTSAQQWKLPDSDATRVDSQRAGGSYKITRQAEINLKCEEDHVKCLLTTWIVDRHRLGIKTPTIDTQVLDRIRNTTRLAIAKRRDRLLRWFSQKSSTIGTAFEIKEHMEELLAWSECIYNTGDTRGTGEIYYLIDFCAEEGLLKMTGDTRLLLTPRGYDYLDRLDRVNIGSEQAFVAMWFDKSMDEAYDAGIRPAIQEAGYRPLRIDQKEHINRIDDEIIAEIRRTRFVVADFTSNPSQPRGGVYFEAGFAYGLGIPVIWTCRHDVIRDVHFDTRQFNHIVWSTGDDLFKPLKNRIEALIGQGPLKQ